MNGDREIDLEHLNPLIKEYEGLISALTEQLEHYKLEQNYLKSESVTLLQENKALSSYIRARLEKFDESDFRSRHDENDLVRNLRQQIQQLLKEKESTTELWKNSVQTIDHLEDELRLHQGRTHGYVSKSDVKKIKEENQKRIKQLEMELMHAKVSLLESQKSTKSVIDLKTSELKQLNETYQETSKAVQHLQNNLQQLQEENQNLRKEVHKSKAVLKEKEKLISGLRAKEKESQNKVVEAIQIVEAALLEKDAALLREKQAKGEILDLTKTLSENVEKANNRLDAELESAKKQYVEKAQKLKTDMKNLTDFLKQKELELERQKNAATLLEEKLNVARKSSSNVEDSNTSKLLVLEKNLESTFQKLLMSEKKNVRLEAENKSVKDDLEQMANMYERDVKTREIEKRALESKITALQNDLEISSSGLIQVASKVETVNSKLIVIETDLKKQLHLKDVKNEKVLANKVKEIETANSKLNRNVKKRLEDQIQFNKKWKATVNEVVEKLEKRVGDLKQETHSLRQIKKELTQKLRETEQELDDYRERLKSLCLDVTKVASFSKEHLTEKESHVRFTDSGVEKGTG